MPLIPALRGQSQLDFCYFKNSMVYRSSSRTARATERKPVSGGGLGGTHTVFIEYCSDLPHYVAPLLVAPGYLVPSSGLSRHLHSHLETLPPPNTPNLTFLSFKGGKKEGL